MIRLSLLLLGLALLGCKRQPSPTVFLDPALVTLVSSDTIFLAGVRMEQLRQTPLFKKFIAPGKLALVENFRKDTGVDIRNDIWEVLLSSNGKDAIAMLRGKFTEMGMEPRLQREGLERLGYKGYTMLGDERIAVAFLNPTTAIAGPTPALRRLIDRRNDASGLPKRLEEKIGQISSNNQVWFAGDASGRLPGLELDQLSAMLKLLGNVQLVWGGIDLRQGFHARIDAAVATDADAAKLRDAVRGLVGFGRLSTPDNRPELLRLYDAIQVDAASRSVKINLIVPEPLLEELVGLISTASERESRRQD